MATRRGPDGSVRFSVTGQVAGIPWANVYWAILAGGASAPQADLDSWLGSVAVAAGIRYKSHINSNASILGCQAVLFQTGGTALHSVDTNTQTGTHSGTAVEDNSACKVVSWATTAYWRGGKPRTYLPGLSSDETDDGLTINSTTKSSVVTDFNGFKNDVNGVTHGAITSTTMVLMSFVSGGVDRGTPVSFPITGAAVHSRIGTQRRRLGPWRP